MDMRQRSVCGRKHKHKSKDTAENHIVALVLSGKAYEGDMEAYKCPFCGSWHVGHAPATSKDRRSK